MAHLRPQTRLSDPFGAATSIIHACRFGHGLFHGRRGQVPPEPELGRPPASLAQALEEAPVEIARAFLGQAGELLVRRYPSNPQPPELPRA